MVIISAGVVMNLIFGVLMAAWAFRVGVPYEPAIVAQVNPGDPAWMNGVQPGDRIVQIGSLQDNELSFRDMFMTVLFQGLRDPKTEMDVGVVRDGTQIPMKFQGTIAHTDPKLGIQKLSLGVRGPTVTKLDSKEALSKSITFGLEPEDANLPKFLPGDIITGINGTALDVSRYGSTPLEYSLNQQLHPRMHEKVTVQVRRSLSKEEGQAAKFTEVDVEWAPVPMKSLGLRFKPGKVSAVLKDSPADLAGVKVGDSLISINGELIEDSFKAALGVAKQKGKSVTLAFERQDKTTSTLEWTVPEQFIFGTSDVTLGPVGLELLGSGLVYSVSNVVSGVEPGSTAAKSGLAPGDIIKQIQFDGSASLDKEYLEKVFVYGYSQALEPTQVDNARSVQYFYNQIQSFRTGFPVKIGYERDGKIASAQADVHSDSQWFWPDRAANFSAYQVDHKADAVLPALAMGLKEIRRRMGNVLEFLELLVKGKMPFKVVGGPGMIAVEASDAASKGISPLLMFLVMLSANLAIVNFLPIPALDGGHMMFLTAEAILGRPVDEALQMKLTMAGVIGLLCLMAAVLVNDTMNLTRMFGG
jgi:regulator of sigma E protease